LIVSNAIKTQFTLSGLTFTATPSVPEIEIGLDEFLPEFRWPALFHLSNYPLRHFQTYSIAFWMGDTITIVANIEGGIRELLSILSWSNRTKCFLFLKDYVDCIHYSIG
jgi:hypothetical protein